MTEAKIRAISTYRVTARATEAETMSETMNWRAWDRESGGQRLCYEYEKMPEGKSGLVGGLWCWGVPSGSGYRRVTKHDLPAWSEVPEIPVWIGKGDDPRGRWEVTFMGGVTQKFTLPQRVVDGAWGVLGRNGRWRDYGQAESVRLVPWPEVEAEADEPAPDPRDARIAELEAEAEELRRWRMNVTSALMGAADRPRGILYADVVGIIEGMPSRSEIAELEAENARLREAVEAEAARAMKAMRAVLVGTSGEGGA